MKIIVPDYYKEFHCIASACHHTCCKGWEIDIDAESYAYYQAFPGAFGERLRANIVPDPENENVPGHFRLCEEERCPFLNKENLCDMILHLGEESLCQICTDHPRFRNYWSDCTEEGLGMVCEEAARIILSKKDPMKLIVKEEDGETEEPAEEGESMLKEIRDHILEILQDRSIPVDERIVQMLEYCHIEEDLQFTEGPLNETACEQLAVYLVYRNYADVLYDGRLLDRVKFCADSYARIRNEWAANGSTEIADLIEPARYFSEKVEYDTDTWGLE